MESQRRPQDIHFPQRSLHPLCAPQFALVSNACGMLSFTPGLLPSPILPPPSPSSPDDEGHKSDHHHHHRHRHGHHSSTEEDNCCRWAKEMDSRCVCEILVRLPPFLTRPLHQYSVVIGESCVITYSCGGPI
ncbi:uncharacterized protein [Cicer arietinum]